MGIGNSGLLGHERVTQGPTKGEAATSSLGVTTSQVLLSGPQG